MLWMANTAGEKPLPPVHFLYMKMIILPRQARDKHRESTQHSQKDRFLAEIANLTSNWGLLTTILDKLPPSERAQVKPMVGLYMFDYLTVRPETKRSLPGRGFVSCEREYRPFAKIS